jgi:TRAP-type mannitol/chloroaromatic compound transport system permease large subunit
MIEFIIANMAPLMFGSLVLFLLFGYPVAFALAANGIVFGLIGIEARPAHAGAVPGPARAHLRHHGQRHAAGHPLLHLHGPDPRAIGMAEDLLDTIGQLFGPMRGGLASR